MKLITNYLTVTVLGLFILYVAGANKNGNSVVDEDPVQLARELVKDFLNNTANGLTPGLVIGVSVKGQRQWLEGFGLANIENNIPMTSDAVMQIGSIGKSFTFGLASRLMYEGKLDFDVPIREYLSLDDFPDKTWNGKAVNITLRQLFTMTSGIPNGPSDILEIGTCLHCSNQSGRLAFVRDKDLEFEPGTNFSYSNFGIELAGAVMEKVLENKTFNVAYMEMVKNVLKLNNTGLVNTTLITPKLASFYTTDMENIYNSGMWGDIFLNDLPAAGGITSTISDLLTYAQTWLDAYYGRSEHFVKQSTVKEAWTPTDVSKGGNLPYGYGLTWVITNVTESRPSGSQVVWHNGGTLGCKSIVAIYPETEIIVAASVNLAQSPIDEFVLQGNIADVFANMIQTCDVKTRLE